MANVGAGFQTLFPSAFPSHSQTNSCLFIPSPDHSQKLLLDLHTFIPKHSPAQSHLIPRYSHFIPNCDLPIVLIHSQIFPFHSHFSHVCRRDTFPDSPNSFPIHSHYRLNSFPFHSQNIPIGNEFVVDKHSQNSPNWDLGMSWERPETILKAVFCMVGKLFIPVHISQHAIWGGYSEKRLMKD